MAKIKEIMMVSLEEFGKKAGEYALDEFEYKGLTIRQWADKITSGEYQPVKHGKWEVRTQKDGTTIGQHNVTYCSECGYVIFTKENSFCARCGARMDGDSDD